jgi:hypothetical protein
VSDLLEPIEVLAEEMLRRGEGLPDGAGVSCGCCGWTTEVPWALREQLDELVEAHTRVAHPEALAGPDDDDDEDEDEDDEDDEDEDEDEDD